MLPSSSPSVVSTLQILPPTTATTTTSSNDQTKKKQYLQTKSTAKRRKSISSTFTATDAQSTIGGYSVPSTTTTSTTKKQNNSTSRNKRKNLFNTTTTTSCSSRGGGSSNSSILASTIITADSGIRDSSTLSRYCGNEKKEQQQKESGVVRSSSRSTSKYSTFNSTSGPVVVDRVTSTGDKGEHRRFYNDGRSSNTLRTKTRIFDRVDVDKGYTGDSLVHFLTCTTNRQESLSNPSFLRATASIIPFSFSPHTSLSSSSLVSEYNSSNGSSAFEEVSCNEDMDNNDKDRCHDDSSSRSRGSSVKEKTKLSLSLCDDNDDIGATTTSITSSSTTPPMIQSADLLSPSTLYDVYLKAAVTAGCLHINHHHQNSTTSTLPEELGGMKRGYAKCTSKSTHKFTLGKRGEMFSSGNRCGDSSSVVNLCGPRVFLGKGGYGYAVKCCLLPASTTTTGRKKSSNVDNMPLEDVVLKIDHKCKFVVWEVIIHHQVERSREIEANSIYI